MSEDMDSFRAEMDKIDGEILPLLVKRLEISGRIGEYKRDNNLPVYDREREREMLCRLTASAPPGTFNAVRALYNSIFEISRGVQAQAVYKPSTLQGEIEAALAGTPKVFPPSAIVACQGLEGAYSQLAAGKLFALPDIMYFGNFEGVFQAVQSGLCRYGVLPLENSTAGSVNEVYDLMNRYSFFIVRSVRLRVNHTLMSKQGVKLADVKEILSKDEALEQCGNFIRQLKGVKVTVCENTAAAAKSVAESDRTDIAAICSEDCANLYNLSALSYDIQNNGGNYTRFICISKNLEIYPGAHKTSLMLTLQHKPGALYNALAKFNALGINLNKLESRPIPSRDFEFKFYFDIDVSVYSEEFMQALSQLEREADMFDYLGSYQEL